MSVARAKKGEAQRFIEDMVLRYEGSECLLWPYSMSAKGYAKAVINGKSWLVHRYACEKENGPPPFDGAHAAHSCGNGNIGCVAKRHQRWATATQNENDKEAHGTKNIGSRNGGAKISPDDAIEIFSLKGIVTQRAIAERYGIAFQTVSKIHNGKKWGWLTGAANDNSVTPQRRTP